MIEIELVEKKRLVIPQLEVIYRRVAPLGYVLIRIVIALVFLQDGIEKFFFGGADRIAVGNVAKLGLAFPHVWAWTVASLDLFGSILLGVGLFVRPVTFAFLVQVLVISFGIAAARGFFWTTNGSEIALMMAACFAAFVLGGGGRYSIDRLIGYEF